MQSPRQIAVFGSFLANAQSGEFAIAEEVGYLLAKRGFQVICGGHGGIADPLVAGVTRGGGSVLGVALAATKYPGRIARMNPLITERVSVRSISERLEFFSRADGFIFFTGGIGTLSEFAFIWHSLQLGADFSRSLVLVSGCWEGVLARIRSAQMIKYKYYRLLHLCERPEDIVAVASRDYSVKYADPKNLLCKKAVLFDLDGVLVESPEEEIVKGCEDSGFFYPIQDVEEAVRRAGGSPSAGGHIRSLYENALVHLGIKARSATEMADHVGKEGRHVPQLYEDAADILRYCRERGVSAGVVSERQPEQVKEILSAHGLSGWVDLICPLSHPAGGPDRKVWDGLLETFGCKKDGIVHVGVNLRHSHLFARAMGIDTILLDRHLNHLADAEAVKIRSLEELKYLIIGPDCS